MLKDYGASTCSFCFIRSVVGHTYELVRPMSHRRCALAPSPDCLEDGLSAMGETRACLARGAFLYRDELVPYQRINCRGVQAKRIRTILDQDQCGDFMGTQHVRILCLFACLARAFGPMPLACSPSTAEVPRQHMLRPRPLSRLQV